MYNRKLDTFLLVAETGSFSKAGEKLFISPTAVIKQITGLETGYGVKLFERTPNGVTLTSAGEQLYKETMHIIRFANSALQRVKDAAGEREARLVIGMSDLLKRRLLTDRLPAIQKTCPSIRLEIIYYNDSIEVLEQISAKSELKIDIFFDMYNEFFLWTKNLAAVELFRTHICYIVPKQHPLAGRETLDWSLLEGETLYLFEKNRNYYMDCVREDIVRNRRRIQLVDVPRYDEDTVKMCVEKQYIMMSLDCWRIFHPDARIMTMNTYDEISCGMIYSKNPADQVKTFVQAVQAADVG